MSSPYKKLKTANSEWIQYTQIKMLMKNKPYKMLGMVETKHSEYGDGQCATLMSPLGKKLRTQLPKKYLAQLSRDDVRTIKGDIMDGKPIFLVFREIMADNSYRIDITEAGEGWIKSFEKDEEVPELEDSVENISINESLDMTSNEDPKNPTEDNVNSNTQDVEGSNDDSQVKSEEAKQS